MVVLLIILGQYGMQAANPILAVNLALVQHTSVENAAGQRTHLNICIILSAWSTFE